jgi:hypothetical protein
MIRARAHTRAHIRERTHAQAISVTRDARIGAHGAGRAYRRARRGASRGAEPQGRPSMGLEGNDKGAKREAIRWAAQGLGEA